MYSFLMLSGNNESKLKTALLYNGYSDGHTEPSTQPLDMACCNRLNNQILQPEAWMGQNS
jgi:hypothetical protein